jgi:hypothetical protein
LRIAKKISKEENARIKKFTDDLMGLMKDILDDPKSPASTMLKDYMDIMRLKRDFSKHPSLPDNGYIILSSVKPLGTLKLSHP